MGKKPAETHVSMVSLDPVKSVQVEYKVYYRYVGLNADISTQFVFPVLYPGHWCSVPGTVPSDRGSVSVPGRVVLHLRRRLGWICYRLIWFKCVISTSTAKHCCMNKIIRLCKQLQPDCYDLIEEKSHMVLDACVQLTAEIFNMGLPAGLTPSEWNPRLSQRQRELHQSVSISAVHHLCFTGAPAPHGQSADDSWHFSLYSVRSFFMVKPEKHSHLHTFMLTLQLKVQPLTASRHLCADLNKCTTLLHHRHAHPLLNVISQSEMASRSDCWCQRLHVAAAVVVESFF